MVPPAAPGTRRPRRDRRNHDRASGPRGGPGHTGSQNMNRVAGIRKLQRVLEYRWRRRDLLEQALRHPSCVLNRIESNQRLEFIGDSVIDLVVGIHLMRAHPDESEGFLAQAREALVNEEALATRGRALDLHELVWVQTRGGHLRSLDSTAAECMEAVVGSAFIDSGHDYDVAARVIANAGILG